MDGRVHVSSVGSVADSVSGLAVDSSIGFIADASSSHRLQLLRAIVDCCVGLVWKVITHSSRVR